MVRGRVRASSCQTHRDQEVGRELQVFQTSRQAVPSHQSRPHVERPLSHRPSILEAGSAAETDLQTKPQGGEFSTRRLPT